MLSVWLSALAGGFLYFALHLTASGSFPRPLTAAQERECLQKIKEGDQQARDYFIEHNLRLVAHIIKKYYASYKEQEDLISIGTIGLIKAVGTFDSNKGIRFATYASRCIENEILMHFRGRKKYAQDLYIQDPIDVDTDGNALTLMDIMAQDGDILEDVDRKLKSDRLHSYINQALDAREQQVIRLRYGLDGKAPMAQREVAALLGISRSYVSRIEKKAVGILRGCFADEIPHGL
ncbi:MAG: RNA polymerase sporulation sigma factor SigK [Oscillospiraceae bacterium]|nr:RNA polymerase sporulation sigma factor SigK [Oscillospiraceae bacterium]MDD7042149.1 RNA polymerase sporulation sigma factor SigK [Oscillospiraceae bacterium]MDY2611924.1 RNA polymerase sporulation sigma factor SigK [Oscillospiraceae bacterium]